MVTTHTMRKKQEGQVLLIIVLVATVLVTVALSVSRVTTEEQKVSKLEAESKRAFAAAEAGLEAALKQGDVNDLGTLNLGSGITGTAKLQTSTNQAFNSPLIKKDDMMTFYLSTYDIALQKITGAAFSGSIQIGRTTPSGSYCATNATQFAVELTFINSTSKTIATRKLIDECSLIDGTTDKIAFGQSIDLSATPANLLVVRVIAPDQSFSGTTLTINNNTSNWPLQGKTIVSEAKTAAGAAEKIQLFQSYPQLPAEFWVTSF